jgi:prepilin-type N-terminal cleavage/methylation domain-containing protein
MTKSETGTPQAEGNPKAEIRQSNLYYNSARGELPQRNAENTKDDSILCVPCALSRASAGFGFTLIELLIVIAIIAILAAMIIPISGAVTRNRIKAKARTELENIATAIDLYKAKFGHYPPDNSLRPDVNQLYFELKGTTLTNGTYATLDNSAQVAISALPLVFGPGVGGFINTTRTGAGDESQSATSFLNNLKPDETVTVTNPPPDTRAKFLVAAVPNPKGAINYFSYVSSSPTNNPNSYDLWVDVIINGKTNRLSNWTTTAVVLP